MKNFLKRFSIIEWIVIVLAIAINVFIIVNACLPGDPSSKESGWVASVLQNIINGIKPDTINASNIDTFNHMVRKLIGHFSLFLVSGLLTTLSIKFIYYDLKRKFAIFVIISSSFGLFLAFLTELIQLFIPGRSGEITDALIDFSGYIIPVLIISLITYLKRNKISDMKNEQ